MFFKNLLIYRLPADWNLTAPALEDQLSSRPLLPCGAFDMQSRGWVPSSPAGRLVHTVGNQQLIALGVDQKLLPGSIIRQVANERAEALAAEQGFPVGRRQLRDLKMRVTEELRARALTRRRMTRAWIDPEHGWFVVDSAGAARGEELVETLRDTLGSFAVQMLGTERSPQSSMAAWLRVGEAPLRFSIEQDLELQSVDKARATIRYARHPLEGQEIQKHLAGGMYATKLGLTWNDRISFVLTEKLQVKRVEFLEVGQDTGEGDELEPVEQFDIDFTVMAGELAALLGDLAEALGGESRKEAA